MRIRPSPFVVLVLMGLSTLFTSLSGYGRKNLKNLEKVGHRVVAHPSIISPAKEIEIGKLSAMQFNKTVDIIHDPWVERYLSALANKVVLNSDFKGSITVSVIKSPAIDCFSLPGGFIYLTSGLLASAENEDEIAGVIAHQVAHATTRSWAAQMSKVWSIQQAAGLSTSVASAGAQAGSLRTPEHMACPGYSPFQQESRGLSLALLKLRRQDELEADYLGLQYMVKAGYNPRDYVVLLRKHAQADISSPVTSVILDEMPTIPERIAQAEGEIRNDLPNVPHSTKRTSEFVVLKSRF